MTRIVVKGLNFTEMRTTRKGSEFETVQFWKLAKKRKAKECGVWIDGRKLMDFEKLYEIIGASGREGGATK